MPWTWYDYAGYRDAVNAMGAGINLAPLVGHSPLRLAVMGDDAWTRAATDEESGAMAALLEAAMAAGAWGLSTSLLDVDGQGRPVPSRAADGAEFDVLLDVLAAGGRGVVEMVPDLLGGSRRGRAGGPGPSGAGPRGMPLTWTGFVHVAEATRAHRGLDRAPGGWPPTACGFYPQLSPRTVDFRLNWDSSMMFMSMPEGWHRVIAAEGTAAKAALLADPEWRATAREEWDRTESGHVPAPRPRQGPHRGGASATPRTSTWLGRTLADLVAAAGRPPLRRARRLRPGQRLPARHRRGRAWPTPTWTAWAAPSPTPPC